MRIAVPLVGGLTLLAGVIAVLIVFVGNTGKSLETPIRNEPATVFKEPKTVPLAREARMVAGRFIQTAVARKNLAESWRLVGPGLKQGMTLAQWRTGNIPVVPYLAEIDKAPIKIDHSYRDDALLEVLLVPKSAKVKPQIFLMELKAFGEGKQRHWLVTSWVPRGNVAVPSTLSN